MNHETRKNLALAVLIGLLFGLSPHTSSGRTIPKIAGGIVIGLVVLALRMRSRRGVEAEPADAAAVAPESVPPLVWVTLALSLLLFLVAAEGLYTHYTEDIWTNGHGLFVPWAVLALGLAALRRDPSAEVESSAWGWAPIVAGTALIVLDSAVVTLYVSILGLLLLLFGLSLLLLGPRRTRALAFPLFLLLFLAPLPTSLAMPLGLTRATASGAGMVLHAFGSPALVDDAVIHRPAGVFGVSANCSGFSMFYAALGLALVLGYCGRSRLRAALLLLAVWPLVAFASALRAAAVVRVWEATGYGFDATPLHGLSGIAAFWFVMIALFLMADRRGLRETFT